MNLDNTIYGSFAEIGAGQEAGWSCRSRRSRRSLADQTTPVGLSCHFLSEMSQIVARNSKLENVAGLKNFPHSWCSSWHCGVLSSNSLCACWPNDCSEI